MRRQIIQEQVASAQMMLERSVQSFLEHTPAPRLTFADRGIPDTLGYARLIGLTPESWIRLACEKYCYAPRVFIAPPWKTIYETDTERSRIMTKPYGLTNS